MSAAKIEKLVRMANQIGDFFAPMPEPEGAARVANHLKRFWTPKMIGEIVDATRSGHGGLNPTALAAVQTLSREQST